MKIDDLMLIIVLAAWILVAVFALLGGLDYYKANSGEYATTSTTLKPMIVGVKDGFDFVMVKSPNTQGYLGAQYSGVEFYTLTGANQTYYLVFTPLGVAFRMFEKVDKKPEEFKWTQEKNVYRTYSILGNGDPEGYVTSCWVTYNISEEKRFACFTLVNGNETVYKYYLANLTTEYPPKEPLRADYWDHDIPENYWVWNSE